MKNPRILVGCPTYKGKEYILERYAKRVKELDHSNYDVLLVDNSKGNGYIQKIRKLNLRAIKAPYRKNPQERIAEARNVLRKHVLDNDYDYFFSLEQDVIPPKNILQKLLSHNKEVVGGWYFITKNPFGGEFKGLYKQACVAREWRPLHKQISNQQSLDFELGKQELMKSAMGSLGVMLIHRNVLKQIKFRLIPRFNHPDDTWFFYDCDKKGIEIWTDTELLVPHFQSKFPDR